MSKFKDDTDRNKKDEQELQIITLRVSANSCVYQKKLHNTLRKIKVFGIKAGKI